MLKEFLLYVGFNDLNSLFGGPFTQSAFFHSKALFSIVFICKHVYGCVASRKWFLVFLLYYGRIVIRLQAMWEREGDGIGKGPWVRTRTRDACSAIALSVCVLPTRLLARTIATFLRCGIKILNFYTQCRSSMSRPKPQTNQMTPEAGQELQAFVDSIKLFYLTLRRHVKTRSVWTTPCCGASNCPKRSFKFPCVIIELVLLRSLRPIVTSPTLEFHRV